MSPRNTLFRWTWEAPADWQRLLNEFFPRNEVFAWPMLVWLPGERWRVAIPGAGHKIIEQPIQRWAIYQMIPRASAEDWIVDELEGPHPRTLGHWKWNQGATDGEWVTEALVSRVQWELYRQTRCVPKRFWLIQGDRGGHKFEFSNIEQRALKRAKLPTEPPEPGALPFAPFDLRVVEKLLAHDRLRKFDRYLSTPEARNAQRHAEGLRERQEFRRETLKWLRDQAAQAVAQVTNAAGTPAFETSDLKVRDESWVHDEARSDEAFIQDDS